MIATVVRTAGLDAGSTIFTAVIVEAAWAIRWYLLHRFGPQR